MDNEIYLDELIELNSEQERIFGDFIADNPALRPLEEAVLGALNLLRETYDEGGKVLICGNGGSAADAEHIVGELMKGFLKRRPLDEVERAMIEETPDMPECFADKLQGGLPAFALTAHSALISAYANDVDADMVFAQQVWAMGEGGDLLIALSTSGNSKNVVNAVHCARAKGIKTLGITGSKESKLSALCDVCIKTPTTETYRVQEYTLPIYHALCALIEAEYFEK